MGTELWFVILDESSTVITESSTKKGMSAIAALFMIIFNDEQAAFWALCSFMIKTPWTQKGMFLPGFPKLNHFTSMWEKILETTMPKISRHFEEEGVIPQIYLTKWFLQNFLDRLPFHLCIRLWDLFLLEGELETSLGNTNLFGNIPDANIALSLTVSKLRFLFRTLPKSDQLYSRGYNNDSNLFDFI